MVSKKKSCQINRDRLNRYPSHGCVAQRYEHYVDIVGVTSSILVTPTIFESRLKPAFFLYLEFPLSKIDNRATGVFRRRQKGFCF